MKGQMVLLLFLGLQNFASGIYDQSNDDMVGNEDSTLHSIPYTLPWDNMPVDLSFIYEKEKPAGKHGFLKVEADRFIFEDGTEAKFWGTNFNSAQCFPSHEHSRKIAKRLAKTGVNIVRFHQMDAEWSTPNIFQFTKGENIPNTMNFDPASLDRLDYLIYSLKQEGIYVYMDLLTYRRFKTGDGVENAGQLGDAAKPYSTFNKRLIELQKKYNYDLWNHINPYTGMAYKDDPVIALTAITNECDLLSQRVTIEPYRSELEERYRKWAKEKGIKVQKGIVEFNPDKKQIQEFFVEVTKAYYQEMIQHMREAGVRIPIAGTNWSRNQAHLSSQLVADFTDSHAYWYGWNWGMNDKSFMNESMSGSVDNMLPYLSFNKVAGKPFFVSEWDDPWPNEWRAESPLLLAAVGSLQGWGGFAVHTYRYTVDENVDMIGKPITSDAIGGVYYRGGVFDTFNDPAKFGLFYHAALIIRRGDVGTPEKITKILIKEPSRVGFNHSLQALKLTPEKQRIAMVLEGATSSDKADLISSDESIVDVERGEVKSDNGELYRNLKKKFGWIDTPNTKAVYGFVGQEGDITLTGMKVNVKTDFSTVAISTLTEQPINRSSNMLLTAVGRADNTNSRYNEDHTKQLSPGEGPIQVEIIEATIAFETAQQNLRVMAINPQGLIIGYIPSEYHEGIFRFSIGKEYQSMYYLIQDI